MSPAGWTKDYYEEKRALKKADLQTAKDTIRRLRYRINVPQRGERDGTISSASDVHQTFLQTRHEIHCTTEVIVQLNRIHAQLTA